MPRSQEHPEQLRRPTTPAPVRKAAATMYIGVAFTLLAVLVVVVDQATADGLARHLEDAYPDYSSSRVDSVKSSILTYLFAIGVAGICLWLWMARASKKGKGWSRTAATVVFALSTFIALYNFTQHFPLYVTVTGLLPCAVGLVAVAFLWNRDSTAYFSGRDTTA
ncbi:hypothetical protein [Streptomyces albireticuli]|uniref:hypothetical protein n=1 Tax=Streptomyces albireticuli TaxID=1940 RepID=UPI0036C3B13D